MILLESGQYLLLESGSYLQQEYVPVIDFDLLQSIEVASVRQVNVFTYTTISLVPIAVGVYLNGSWYNQNSMEWENTFSSETNLITMASDTSDGFGSLYECVLPDTGIPFVSYIVFDVSSSVPSVIKSFEFASKDLMISFESGAN